MSYSPNELKAINWYQEEFGYKVQLSTRPYVYFRDKNGEEIKVHIMHLMKDWEEWRKEEKRNKGS